MIYFQPVTPNIASLSTSVVPFTAPATGYIQSHWVLPRSAKYGHYDYTATVSVNNTVVWTMTDIDEGKVRANLHKTISKINSLAARNASGIFDLME